MLKLSEGTGYTDAVNDLGKHIIFILVTSFILASCPCHSESVPNAGQLLRYIPHRYQAYRQEAITGRINWSCQYNRYFHHLFFTPDLNEMPVASDEHLDAVFARYKRFSENPDFDFVRFSEINSREYEYGYDFEQISIGEQLLYNIGLVLLQMSASELDRRN